MARFRSHESWLLLAVILASVLISLRNPSFLSLRNAQDIVTSNAFAAILAAGLLVVLISGGIDISFTAIATVSQYVAFSLALSMGIGWVGVIAVLLGVGIVLGWVNALFIHQLRVPSIIVTLSTLNIFYGLLIFVTKGEYIYELPDWLSSTFSFFEYRTRDGVYYSFNLQIFATLLVFLATWVILRKTRLGQQIKAFGGNPEAARRIGLPIWRIQFFVYGWMGMCAGIASLVQAQVAQSIAPTALVGRELDVLAAVVLGGASLQGGTGSVWGTLLGLALLFIVQNGLVLVGLSSYWTQLATGLILLCAITATALRRRPGGRGR
jgi:simple sugar transport system permease protein